MKFTLSSTVSHFVTNIPSIPRPLPTTPETEEKSRNARSNLVNWSTASLPTSASPTKMILSGLLVDTNWWGRKPWVKRCWHTRKRTGFAFSPWQEPASMAFCFVLGVRYNEGQSEKSKNLLHYLAFDQPCQWERHQNRSLELVPATMSITGKRRPQKISNHMP